MTSKISRKEPYRYIGFLSMLYVIGILSSSIFINKQIYFWHIYLLGGHICFPLTYAIGDIVAEVYGYEKAKQMVWYAYFCLLLFTLLKAIVIWAPFPSDWTEQHSFEVVFKDGFRYFIAVSLAVMISELLNVYVISKLKVLIKSKYFGWRCISASSTGHIINTILFLLILLAGTMSWYRLIEMIIASIVFKELYALLVLYPTAAAVKWLQQNEKVQPIKTINYNPFL